MKITFRLKGPKGAMGDIDVTYHNLPDQDAAAIHAVCEEVKTRIEELTPAAGSGEKQYDVDLDWRGEGYTGQAARVGLRYSQALECETWCLEGLKKLLDMGYAEVASGERS